MRLIITFLLLSCTCYGQQFKKLRFGIGCGATFDWPAYSTNNKTSTPVIYLEPSYRINDQITIGWRMEVGMSGLAGTSTMIASYGLNAQHYFSNKDFRPFIGLGVGFFKPGKSSDPSAPISQTINNEKTTFGFYPRVGFDYHHLTLNIEYNFAPPSSTTITTYDNGQTIREQGELKNSYGSVKLGLVIGGGRKKN